MSETTDIKIKKLSDDVKALTRRVSDLSREVATLDQDREILEGIQAAIRSLEEATKVNKEHIDTIFKAIQLEVKVQGERTETSMGEVKDKVEEHISDLVENIEKKKVILVKEPFFTRMKKLFGK